MSRIQSHLPHLPPLPAGITLRPVEAGDYHALATLEAVTFDNDDFSVLAFGPLRHSPANLALSAASLSSKNTDPDKRDFITKAVLTHAATGEEEIVGYAQWRFVTGRLNTEVQTYEREGVKKPGENQVASEKKEELSAEEKQKKDDETWGAGANVKFCEDAFFTADEHMLDSCGGKDYCKLRTLAVHPSQQRRGIGAQLLYQGLAEADNIGLQSILASSPDGEGLYKRFGFKEYKVMRLNLRKYVGGEQLRGDDGDGIVRHVVMHRPAAGTD